MCVSLSHSDRRSPGEFPISRSSSSVYNTGAVLSGTSRSRTYCSLSLVHNFCEAASLSHPPFSALCAFKEAGNACFVTAWFENRYIDFFYIFRFYIFRYKYRKFFMYKISFSNSIKHFKTFSFLPAQRIQITSSKWIVVTRYGVFPPYFKM